MQHLALLALEDHEVDLLSRVRQRDDVRLGAVYHPDPAALVVRLAGLAHVPVVFDIEALAALPIDFVVGGEKAAPAVRELVGRASREGREAPLFVPAHDFDLYLRDPDAYRRKPEGSGAEAEPPVEHSVEVPAEAIRPTVQVEDAVGASLEEADTIDIPVPSRAIEETEPAPAAVADAAGPEPAPRHDGTAGPAGRADVDLGAPSFRDLYDPQALGRWLVETALAAGGGSAAVLWRREADGRRFSLLAFAPDADRLPTVPFPPLELEAHVTAASVRVVDLPKTEGRETPPLSLLAAPLSGDRGPFGLLGVFRPHAAGPFSDAFRAEIAARAGDFGTALERSADYAGMGAELRSLRFKERIRDLMLDPRAPASERWSRLLEFLVMETQADFAQFYRLSDDGARLSLEAAAGGGFEGWVSIPVGRGLIGRAFDREGVTVCTGDDAGDDRGLTMVPVRAGRDDDARPVGLLVVDGAVPATASGDDTARVLSGVADILAPLLRNPPGGRA